MLIDFFLKPVISALALTLKILFNAAAAQCFFYCYLVVLQPTLVHFQGGSPTNPMLITVLFLFYPKGHRESRNDVTWELPLQ